MSLLATGKTHLYTGTADSGLVCVISKSGDARCIYDSDEKAITALARDGQGRLYAASAPKGIIYRITPAGTVTTLWDKSKGAIYALATAPSGELYAACGNVIYHVRRTIRVTILYNSNRAQFVALCVGEKGQLMAGSANVGTLYALEPASKGTFDRRYTMLKRCRSGAGTAGSPPRRPDRSFISRRARATRRNRTPPGAPGSRSPSSVSGTHIASPSARFLQYRVTLSGQDASPVLKQVVVSYLPRNRAPAVALATPTAGEFWRGGHEIKWTGSDPDKDTLSYQLFFSSDNGATWKQIGERTQRPGNPVSHPATKPPQAKPVDTQAVAQALAGNPSLARFRADLAAAGSLKRTASRRSGRPTS